MKTENEKQKFIELRAEGLSFDNISKRIKVSKQTLINWQVEFKKDIEMLRLCNYQNTIEKYKLTKQNEIENYLKNIERINKEIESRDLNDVSMKDLFIIRERLQNRVNEIVSGVECETDKTKEFSFMQEREKINID